LKVDLSLARLDQIAIASKLGVIQRFMAQGIRVCIGDVDRDGNRRTTVSPAVANQAFTVAHTLGVTPDFFWSFPWSGAAVAGATESEQNTWNERTITVHSSIGATSFTFLIGTLK
jgi:hypothetical protein